MGEERAQSMEEKREERMVRGGTRMDGHNVYRTREERGVQVVNERERFHSIGLLYLK